MLSVIEHEEWCQRVRLDYPCNCGATKEVRMSPSPIFVTCHSDGRIQFYARWGEVQLRVVDIPDEEVEGLDVEDQQVAEILLEQYRDNRAIGPWRELTDDRNLVKVHRPNCNLSLQQLTACELELLRGSQGEADNQGLRWVPGFERRESERADGSDDKAGYMV